MLFYSPVACPILTTQYDAFVCLQLQDVSGETKEAEGPKVESNDEKSNDLPNEKANDLLNEDSGKETEP